MKKVKKIVKPIKEGLTEGKLQKNTRNQKQEETRIITVEIRNNNANFNSARIAQLGNEYCW